MSALHFWELPKMKAERSQWSFSRAHQPRSDQVVVVVFDCWHLSFYRIWFLSISEVPLVELELWIRAVIALISINIQVNFSTFEICGLKFKITHLFVAKHQGIIITRKSGRIKRYIVSIWDAGRFESSLNSDLLCCWSVSLKFSSSDETLPFSSITAFLRTFADALNCESSNYW